MTVISLAAAQKPAVTSKQRELCKELIGLGIARLTITALMLGKDVSQLNPAEVSTGHRTINSCIKELGYRIIDARQARSPAMDALVRQAAKRCRIRIRIA